MQLCPRSLVPFQRNKRVTKQQRASDYLFFLLFLFRIFFPSWRESRVYGGLKDRYACSLSVSSGKRSIASPLTSRVSLGFPSVSARVPRASRVTSHALLQILNFYYSSLSISSPHLFYSRFTSPAAFYVFLTFFFSAFSVFILPPLNSAKWFSWLNKRVQIYFEQPIPLRGWKYIYHSAFYSLIIMKTNSIQAMQNISTRFTFENKCAHWFLIRPN